MTMSTPSGASRLKGAHTSLKARSHADGGVMTTQEVRVCPGCGMPEDQWKGDGGRGVAAQDGMTYCCRDCAQGRECRCRV